MNTNLIERFFQSDAGCEFQRELSDKNIDQRTIIVDDIDSCNKQMKALLHTKEELKAKEKIALLEKQLKKAKEDYSTIMSGIYSERVCLEKEVSKKKQELAKTAPDYVAACFEGIKKHYVPGLSLSREKSALIRECVAEINRWANQAIRFDEMKAKFSEMDAKISKAI